MADRWPQVKALFQSAAERPAEERDAFLASATGDDEALRREVESLLRCGRRGRKLPRSVTGFNESMLPMLSHLGQSSLTGISR